MRNAWNQDLFSFQFVKPVFGVLGQVFLVCCFLGFFCLFFFNDAIKLIRNDEGVVSSELM